MRLAVSNIAWPAGADDDAARLLVAHGVAGVEVAPARVCERPWEAPAGLVAAYRGFWEDRGLPIVALQALLFGRPELVLFGDAATRRRLSAASRRDHRPGGRSRRHAARLRLAEEQDPRSARAARRRTRSPSPSFAPSAATPGTGASGCASSPTPRPTAATSSWIRARRSGSWSAWTRTVSACTSMPAG